MKKKELLKLLKAESGAWNEWRKSNYSEVINLSRADLSNTNLCGDDLSKANLSGANLTGAYLDDADLREANLTKANLRGAHLYSANLNYADLESADLTGANLEGAYLTAANLNGANLTKANLDGAHLAFATLWDADLDGAHLALAYLRGARLGRANLTYALLVGADLSDAYLEGANLTSANLTNADLTRANLKSTVMIDTKIDNAILCESRIYGISAWDLQGEFKEQRDLIITSWQRSEITVDNIEIAQFIYLILNNKKIRDVINTLTSKTVLILGRFALPERKAILDGLRDKLREYDLVPIVFDFDKPTDKDFTETIKTLAGISYFVIADVTNPKSSPLELQATVPDYQIPFVPIIQEGEKPFAMMANLQTKYGWVLDTISYDSLDTLLEILKPHIIDPAIRMRDKIRLIKAAEPTIISGRELKDKAKRVPKIEKTARK